MRERALLVDGELTIESRPEAGTTVRLRIPAESPT
jgi:signal transduction histidine kinase